MAAEGIDKFGKGVLQVAMVLDDKSFACGHNGQDALLPANAALMRVPSRVWEMLGFESLAEVACMC